MEEMCVSDGGNVEGYLKSIENETGCVNSACDSLMFRSVGKRIVTSIFYKRDLWEIHRDEYVFY